MESTLASPSSSPTVASSTMVESKDGHFNIDVVAQLCCCPTQTAALEETLFWYNGGSDEKSQNLMALKLEVLGPFLFSRSLLSDEVAQHSNNQTLFNCVLYFRLARQL